MLGCATAASGREWSLELPPTTDRPSISRRQVLWPAPLAAPGPTLTDKMSIPHTAHQHEENLELPVEELLRRATVHPRYGEQVIDDLSPEEADAFLDAVLT